VVRLRESDLRAVLESLRDAEAVEGPDPFPPSVLESLTRLIPCDFANFCELDRQRRQVLSDTYSTGDRCDDDDLDDDERRLLWRMIDQHPLCTYQARTHRIDAVKISDFFSRRELHRLELYSERLRPTGTEDELEVGISSSPRYTKNFLFHAAREFDERDRLLLNLLQPHLVYLYRRAAERRALTTVLVALNVAASDDRGVIVLGRFGRVEAATPAARRMLEDYLDEPLASNLNDAVAGWMKEQTTRLNGDTDLPGPGVLLTIELAGRRLRIRLAAESVLLLEEEMQRLAIDAKLGLTRRECEVLRHVARGESNAEIASSLWVAPTTVRKHLEHIYEKLNVSSRTAAVARAFPSLLGADRRSGVGQPPDGA
jgi:DNA-binding CsgD family transcriptional regulator